MMNADQPASKPLADYAYSDEDGSGYTAVPDGCHWDTAREMLLCSDEFLGLCGCGVAGDFDYILGGLLLLDERGPDYPNGFLEWFKTKREREVAHFGNDAAAQFFYKWADKEGFAEHGGSVPGWLTPKGKALVRLMQEARVLEPDDA